MQKKFDALALIYAHFPASIKLVYHKTFSSYLRKGGIVIFEAFSKKHFNYLAKNDQMGGPKDLNMLFLIDEIKSDFFNYEIIELEENEIELKQGAFHNGIGSVIRFIGREK